MHLAARAFFQLEDFARIAAHAATVAERLLHDAAARLDGGANGVIFARANAFFTGSGLDCRRGRRRSRRRVVAQKFGMDGQQASDLLAQVLPNLVDSATPNGNPQEADGFGLDDIASLVLKNFIK